MAKRQRPAPSVRGVLSLHAKQCASWPEGYVGWVFECKACKVAFATPGLEDYRYGFVGEVAKALRRARWVEHDPGCRVQDTDAYGMLDESYRFFWLGPPPSWMSNGS